MISKHLTFWTTLAIILIPLLVKLNNKNSCASYFDYLLINFSENCHYDPDVDLSVPELIQKYTGNLEIYNLTTDDGYQLTMFRIFRQNSFGSIILQPPMSTGSMAWLSDGNQSLAFSLWRKGYDVWLSNHRGISYSRRHIKFSESNPKFWDFSFHEISVFDLDAQFELIRNKTNGTNITYIGYSMSATEALIYASLKPEKAAKYIDHLFLMAPTTVMNHFASPFRYFLQLMQLFEGYFQQGECLSFEIVRSIAERITLTPYFVNLITSFVMGWSPDEMDPTLHPYIFAHHGRGISNKVLHHYSQIISRKNHFPMYDYGEEINKLKYGSAVPPDYPLGKILIPMYIIHGEKDLSVTPMDIEFLCDKLVPKEKILGNFSISNYNHIDFMFSQHRRKKTFELIFQLLRKKNRNKSN